MNRKLMLAMAVAFIISFLIGLEVNASRFKTEHIADVINTETSDINDVKLNMKPIAQRWIMYHVSNGYTFKVENIDYNLRDMYISYKKIIDYHSIGENELPFVWLSAMMFVESKGDPMVRGSQGEYGLFQTLPVISKIDALKSAGLIKRVEDLQDPPTSCAVATYTMCYMLKSQGTLDKATKFYNAGNIRGTAGTAYLKKVKKEFEVLSNG